MSVTEWVIETYTNNSDKEINLEPAKDFVFIWALFESMSKQRLSNGKALSFEQFLKWVNTLEFSNSSISDPLTQNSIDYKLVDNIYKSFNHFYQKYEKDQNAFLNTLYNQSTKPVIKEKEKFEFFMENINKTRVQDKICFMFFITRRIRNKFFHGVKSIGQVSEDHKEFKKSSEYLISIISLLESYQ